jgi:hypothetical protein
MIQKEREENTTRLGSRPSSYPLRNGYRWGNSMISIGVVDQHSFTRGCITRSLKDFDDSLEVISFTTSEDCLQSTKALDLILYHEHENVQQNKGTRLAPIRNLLEIAPVIVLSAADNLESVTQDHEEPAVYSASELRFLVIWRKGKLTRLLHTNWR